MPLRFFMTTARHVDPPTLQPLLRRAEERRRAERAEKRRHEVSSADQRRLFFLPWSAGR